MSTPITYENKYGSVTLTPVTDYMNISEVSANKLPVIQEHTFSMEDAERIALITDNRSIQISFPWILEQGHPRRNDAYVVHHQSPSTVCLCHVELNYMEEVAGGRTPAQEIDRIYVESGAQTRARYCSN